MGNERFVVESARSGQLLTHHTNRVVSRGEQNQIALCGRLCVRKNFGVDLVGELLGSLRMSSACNGRNAIARFKGAVPNYASHSAWTYDHDVW